MSRVPIVEGDLCDTGQWAISKGFRLPLVTCPKCGGLNLGNSSHDVGAGGDVNASLVCGHGCGFHEFVTLQGWSYGAIARVEAGKP